MPPVVTPTYFFFFFGEFNPQETEQTDVTAFILVSPSALQVQVVDAFVVSGKINLSWCFLVPHHISLMHEFENPLN